MKKANLKYLVPNGLTFLSLACGVGSILASIDELLVVAGALIFASYWLDMFDGFSARRLNAQSEFGLQLDSLVDMVSLGVAPGILVYQHLRLQGVSIGWVAPVSILLALAGAFRLARFNMLPPKTTNSKTSVGMTITQSGGTLALAVLADNVQPGGFLPPMVYIPLLLVMSVLMVSTIPFLPASWFFGRGIPGKIFLAFLLLMLVIFPIFSTWFVVYAIYMVVSVGRPLFTKDYL